VTVTLNGFFHTNPDDVDVVLKGPGGQNAIIMSDVGGDVDALGVTLTIDSTTLMPPLPDGSPLVSGTFRPANYPPGDTIPPFVPPPTNFSFGVFNGRNPMGMWKLYIVDDDLSNTGYLNGGWTLKITTCS